MHAGRLSARRLALLVLGVVALHALLIDGVAERLAVGVVPHALRSREAPGVTVRALAPPQRAAPDELLAEDRATPRAPTLAQRVPARDPARRTAPSAALGTTSLVDAADESITARPPVAPAVIVDDAVAQRPPALPAALATPGDAAPPAADDSTAPSLPPVRVPPAFAYVYALTRGGAAGDVELRWRPDGERYVASLAGRDGDDALLGWRSAGGFDAAGIAPQRFVDRRRGRGALAVNFRRDAGKVSFSGPPIEHAIAPGMQDRLSWMLQLAALAAADPARVAAAGAQITVVGVRGDADAWRFEPIGAETIDLPEGAATTLHLLRRPERAYDTRAEVWLAPALHFVPLRARLSNGSQTLELQWRGAAPAP